MPRRPAKPAERSLIHGAMRIADVLTIVPDGAPLLARYGLSCFSCSMSGAETLEEGCHSHGFTDADLQDLLNDLREIHHSRPKRPATIAVTEAAAHALKKILEAETGPMKVLRVQLDDAGGFCMECVDAAQKDDKLFHHPAVPEVSVVASPLTLEGIGGSTIDFRDSRFKLDLPQDLVIPKTGCGCEEEGEGCGCA